MSELIRKYGPMFVLFASSFLTALAFFFPVPALNSIKSELGSWTVIIANMSTVLGLFYLSFSQYRMLERSLSGYFYFMVPYLAIIIHFAVAIAFPGYTNSAQYSWLFTKTYGAQKTMYFALPTFFLFSAAYRAFRVQSIETLALAVGGLLYILSLTPLYVWLFPPILPIGDWILSVPSKAGSRGAIVCIGLAAIILGLRAVAGKEAVTR
jgi:hypothetical protein